MESQFQTSFIPKKPLTEDRVMKARPVSPLIFVATVIFFATLIASAVVAFNKAGIMRSINDAKKVLTETRNNFETDFITQLQKTDKRLTASQQVLGSHITITPIFEGIQDATLKNIQFTKFSDIITTTDTANPKIQVKMTGKAKDFISIAQQSDKLNENKYFHDAVFSNMVVDKDRNVLFDLTFTVDPHYVNYGEALARLNAALVPAEAPVTPPTVDEGTPPVTPPANPPAPVNGPAGVLQPK